MELLSPPDSSPLKLITKQFVVCVLSLIISFTSKSYPEISTKNLHKFKFSSWFMKVFYVCGYQLSYIVGRLGVACITVIFEWFSMFIVDFLTFRCISKTTLFVIFRIENFFSHTIIFNYLSTGTEEPYFEYCKDCQDPSMPTAAEAVKQYWYRE